MQPTVALPHLKSSALAKVILQDIVKGKKKKRLTYRRWEDNIEEWTRMQFANTTREAENRSVEKSFVVLPTAAQVYGME